MASEESAPPKTVLVFSTKSPEEAAIFGLRGSDIQNLRAEPVPGPPATPDEWGFTSPTADGICKYCQLMLHPDPPQLIQHQPNVMHLINSGDTCSTCKWLEISIQRGAASVLAEFQRGNPELCDENNFSRPVTVELTKHEKYIMAVGWVGDRKLYTNGGVPLTISSPSRLGSLATRRFWIPHYELDESEPFKRQDTLKMWLKECESHEQCIKSLPNTKEAKLPTRVLDLTGSSDIPSDPNDIKIKLRETEEGETGTYTALSYCWGANPDLHFKTTSENLQKHKEGISFFDLPLTQRETILATLYLGIRYLWIDGLCIIQDSRQDWEAESVKMGSVYTNAHLTLAATSSDTPDMGLLLPFQGAECVKIHGETVSVRMETHRELDRMSEPLNTRGWTLQEAVLASRIVCFGKEQWLWKCPSRYATEDGLIDGLRDIDGGLIQWADIVQQGPGEDGKNYLRHWYQMVTNYSNRDLTYQSDKWNAIAGLTDMFIEPHKTITQRSSAFFASPSCQSFRSPSPYRRTLRASQMNSEDEQGAFQGSRYLHSLSTLCLPTRQDSSPSSGKDLQVGDTESVYSCAGDDANPVHSASENTVGQNETCIYNDPGPPPEVPDRLSYRQHQRDTSTASSVEWKTWLSSKVSQLEAPLTPTKREKWNDVLPTLGHVRENASMGSTPEHFAPTKDGATNRSPLSNVKGNAQTFQDGGNPARSTRQVFIGYDENVAPSYKANTYTKERPPSIPPRSRLRAVPSLPSVGSSGYIPDTGLVKEMPRMRSLNTIGRLNSTPEESINKRRSRTRVTGWQGSPTKSSPGVRALTNTQPPRIGSPALRGDFGLKYPIRSQTIERQPGDTMRDRESDAQAMGSKTMVDLFLSSRRNQGDGRSSGFGSSPAAFL
ncbi:hypothetical protein ACKLNR_015534 [Fusarium oxysporum f. sp. zingiberi]